MVDLSEDPANLPRMRRLFAQLCELQIRTGDQLDLGAAFPELRPQP